MEVIFIDRIEIERAAIVALITRESDRNDVEASLNELERLLDTAGGEAVVRMIQVKDAPDPKTYIGSGKTAELKSLCSSNDIALVVFDTELSPSQIKNIEDELNGQNGQKDGGIRVIDRSMLILDIFALHATTAEGKLQVELAQLKYTVPRLIGKGLSLSRQQGGNIAMRGPGESKLESDRRHVRRRMHALEEQLCELENNRATQRRQRDRSGIKKVAIAGYTNAGKSTLLNRLTGAGILAEDKLFATLDPTTRKFSLPSGAEILLIDTVGFIRNLPTHLIKAFRSTLDEVAYSDIIIVMVDASDPENAAQLEVTGKLLSELGCSGKPTLYVYNKCDLPGDQIPTVPEGTPKENIIFISALTGEGTDKLITALENAVASGTVRKRYTIPSSEAPSVVASMYREASVESVEYNDNGAEVIAVCDKRAEGLFKKWEA